MSTPTETVRRLTWRDAVQSLVGLVVVALLIAYGMPHLLDTSWEAIWAQLSRVRAGNALLMAVLLVLGLYCFSYVLIASLPGLSHYRALKVNAVASLTANLLPLGGALGLAISFVMFRSWGFRKREISTSMLVCSAWNLMSRILLPVIGCLVLVAGPIDAPAVVVNGALVAGAAGTVVVLVCASVIGSDRVATLVVRVLHRLSGWVRRGGARFRQVEQLVTDQRERAGQVVRQGWGRMTLGMTGQFVFLFGLYWLAARTVGLDLPLAELICAFAFRQLLTLVAITPGGLGVTEVGTAGMLVLFGGDAGAASATALLYAIYAHLLVVPFGLAALAAWWFGPDRAAVARMGAGAAP